MTKNELHVGDAVEVLRDYPDTFDCCVTSPPYGNLRTYKGYEFEAGAMLQAIHASLKDGAVCVWVVGDTTVANDRQLLQFEHAMNAKDAGFKVLDVMVYAKRAAMWIRQYAYSNVFEYMLILVKGDHPKTFNPILEKTKLAGQLKRFRARRRDGTVTDSSNHIAAELKRLTNIWTYDTGYNSTTTDKIAFEHPAIFPEKLAEDHILSWSNEGDTVLDPMCGSGTTCKMALKHDRRYVGIDISEEYVKVARKRLKTATRQFRRAKRPLF